MMLLEHDAKSLLAGRGLPVPDAVLVEAGRPAPETLPAPGVVKAQVPVGGRGKAGGVALARNAGEVSAALDRILGMTIKGHLVRACRVEAPVDYVAEAYASFTVDAGRGDVRIMLSGKGGMDIESDAARAHLLSTSAPADLEQVVQAAEGLAQGLAPDTRAAVAAALRPLAEAFFELEAMLLEINPLFVLADGGWTLGDAKLVLDDNAQPRSSALTALLESRPDYYPEAALKLAQGFDYVLLDPEGDIGLVTTGAGLSMQLVDELVTRGRRPYNFCDIRTGQFRGDPARLIQVLRWIAEGPSIRSVLINFFAGHTDLEEIARLLVLALEQVPELEVPITARMIGNGLEGARAVIAAAGDPILIETDLERAIDMAIARAEEQPARA